MFKRILLILLGAGIILASLYAEGIYSNDSRPTNISIISFPDSNFDIRTDQDTAWHERAVGEVPRYIKANEPGSFNFAETLEVRLGADAIIKIVSLDSSIIHLRLINGELSYNNRIAPSQLIFLQTNQVALEPADFSSGTLQINTNKDVVVAQNQAYSNVTLFSQEQAKRELLIYEGKTFSTNENNISTALLSQNPIDLNTSLNLTNLRRADLTSFPIDKALERLNQSKLAIKTNPVPSFLTEFIFAKGKQTALLKTEIYELTSNLINQLRVNQQIAADNTVAELQQKLNDLQLVDSKQYQDLMVELLSLFGGLNESSRFHKVKELVVKGLTTVTLNDQTRSKLATAMLISPSLIKLETILMELSEINSTDQTNEIQLRYGYLSYLLSEPKQLTTQTLDRLLSLYQDVANSWTQASDQLYTNLTYDLTAILNNFNSDPDISTQTKNSINQRAVENLELFHNKSNIPQNFQIYLSENLVRG